MKRMLLMSHVLRSRSINTCQAASSWQMHVKFQSDARRSAGRSKSTCFDQVLWRACAIIMYDQDIARYIEALGNNRCVFVTIGRYS